MIFREYPKISRLNRNIVVTEKIDGTNAQVYIVKKETVIAEELYSFQGWRDLYISEKNDFIMFVGSRSKWITPNNDNYGFAGWAKLNAEELFNLGEGQHFGEWWGQGIQRRYGLQEKRFSLFNVGRWNIDPSLLPKCVSLVPILYIGPFDNQKINDILKELEVKGSEASPGFMDAEGLVIFHIASRGLYKVTIKDDESPKSLVNVIN